LETIGDFEDILALFQRFDVRYLIVGGLAFAFHAKPRYTKDIDLWVDPNEENVARVNRALDEFGSPDLLDPARPGEILQIGVAPNRIDLIRELGDTDFGAAWNRRVEGRYGEAAVHWIDIDSLIRIKRAIDHPRHQEDARVLEIVRDRQIRKE
jgi:hypothetical protein